MSKTIKDFIIVGVILSFFSVVGLLKVFQIKSAVADATEPKKIIWVEAVGTSKGSEQNAWTYYSDGTMDVRKLHKDEIKIEAKGRWDK